MGRVLLRASVVVAALVLLGAASCRKLPDKRERSLAVFPANLKGVPEVRIVVLDGVPEATLAVTGPYRLDVKHLDGEAETGGGAVAVTVGLHPTADGIKIGQAEVAEARLVPMKGTHFLVNDEDFPYPLTVDRVMRSVDGAEAPSLRVVVHVGLEEYLAGVVGAEMPATWPAEALRAQAVAARTYALYNIMTRKKQPYDVKRTVMSQVWNPRAKASPSVVMAVNSTRGVVLTDNFRLFPAFFHSDCGGYTADAEHVFLKERIGALTTVRCPYWQSEEAPRAWRKSLSRDDLARRLEAAGICRGPVERIQPLDQYKQPLATMDRVYYVEILLKNGVKVTVPGQKFRLAVGHDKSNLRSTYFAVAHSPTAITFEGRGAGHGVGLSQWGAWYMAKEGFLYEDILARYYQGAQLVRLWGEAPTTQRLAGVAP